MTSDVAISIFAAGLDHPEGVAWDPRGAVIAGGEHGQIYRVDADGGTVERIATTDGSILGVALDADGRIYWCDSKSAEVRRWDPVLVTTTYSRGTATRRFAVPNFPAFAESGVLYVSDSGSWGQDDGAIFAVMPDGETIVASTEPAAFTNGLAVSPDGNHLYVVESSLPGISRLRIEPSGGLGPRELVVEMPRTVPDGLAFNADGVLLISCYRPDSIFTWDGAALALLVEDWRGLTLSAPTNLAFIGERLDRLVTANYGGTHLTEVAAGLVGLPLRRPRV